MASLIIESVATKMGKSSLELKKASHSLLYFSYPIQSVDACIECFLELVPFPDCMTEKGLYTRFTEEGIEGIHNLEVDDSKQPEAFEFIGKRILTFSKVPGFNVKRP